MQSALRVFDFSLGQMLWSRRSVFLGLLVGAPIVIALVVRLHSLVESLPVINGVGLTGPTLFGLLIWLLFVRFVVPVLGVYYGTSLIADEVDDKTITYLFTRPVPRSSILIGKYLAYLACVTLLVLPAVIVVYFLIIPIGGNIGQSFPQLAADLGMLFAGLTTYGALFAFVGAALKRPLIVGLVFAFGWESAGLVHQLAAVRIPGTAANLGEFGRPNCHNSVRLVARRAGGRKARVCARTIIAGLPYRDRSANDFC